MASPLDGCLNQPFNVDKQGPQSSFLSHNCFNASHIFHEKKTTLSSFVATELNKESLEKGVGEQILYLLAVNFTEEGLSLLAAVKHLVSMIIVE